MKIDTPGGTDTAQTMVLHMQQITGRSADSWWSHSKAEKCNVSRHHEPFECSSLFRDKAHPPPPGSAPATRRRPTWPLGTIFRVPGAPIEVETPCGHQPSRTQGGGGVSFIPETIRRLERLRTYEEKKWHVQPGRGWSGLGHTLCQGPPIGVVAWHGITSSAPSAAAGQRRLGQ